MFYAQVLEQQFEFVGADGLVLRMAGLVQTLKEGLRTCSCFVELEGHKHPSCGLVDGREQLASADFVLNLGPVLRVHLSIA